MKVDEILGYKIIRDPSIIPEIKSTWPKPYHINRFRDGCLDEVMIIREDEGEPIRMYIQDKYDGTHLQIGYYPPEDAYIARSHSGNPAADWQIKGLTQIPQGKLEELFNILKEYNWIVYEVELFGSKYTPQGYHKNYPLSWDIVVFEIGLKAHTSWYGEPFWINPDKLTPDARPSFLIEPTIEEITPDILDDRNRYDYWKSKIRDGFEGVVLKVYNMPHHSENRYSNDLYNRYYRQGIWIAKVKPDEELKSTKKDKVPDPNYELFLREFIDELKKTGIEEYTDDTREDIWMAAYEVLKSHPELAPDSKNKTKKMIKKAIREVFFSGR